MENSDRTIEEIQRYWQKRASLGQEAGSRDLIAKMLEIEAIAQYVKDGMRILELGCGNGITAIELAKRYDVQLLGIDYATEMVAAAEQLAADEELGGRIDFRVGDVCQVQGLNERFDLIYTERVLINLSDWGAQKQAIINITDRLRPGGIYVMCENSQDGLTRINSLREMIGLQPIRPPWHNLYFNDADLKALVIPGVQLEKIDNYSSTYYFLSRVVNAWLAKTEGHDPAYDAPVNTLALKLPPVGDTAQGKIWLWRKAA